MIRLPVYNPRSTSKAANGSIIDLDSLMSVNGGKVGTELPSDFKIYVPSSLDDYFADETTPILPKYDGPEHGGQAGPERVVPDDDAPEYESPDENSPHYRGHL
jgi:hypothetical protein